MLCDKPALDSEPFFSYLAATQVSELLTVLLALPKNVLDNLVFSLIEGKWADHVLIGIAVWDFFSRHALIPGWGLLGLL